MAKSTYLSNAVLNSVFTATAFTVPAAIYVALFTGNPSSGGIEVSGGSYVRKQGTFTTSSGSALTNTNALTYSNMPATTITHVAFYDSLTGGNLFYYQPSPTNIVTLNGDTVAIPTNGITVTEA